MLAEKTAVATLPVTDLASARKFYEDVLGFRSTGEEMEGVVNYAAGGGSTLLVYETSNAGRNTGTAATFGTGGDLDSIVADLCGRGVSFEHYDMPDMTREGDVHVGGGMRVAWFKDPSGNIICLHDG